MSGIASHASLVAGQWPAASGRSLRQAIPAVLPATAAALLHVRPGDVLRLRDRLTNALVSFDITGVFAPRQGSGPADSYWKLSYFPASGRSASFGSTTYGPLVVSQAALGPVLTMLSGSWVAQPDMTAFGDGDLNSMSASVAALARSLPNSSVLNGAQLVTSLPSVLAEAASSLAVARLTLVISALELLVLAIAALLAVARLLATQREAETALLVARGATRSKPAVRAPSRCWRPAKRSLLLAGGQAPSWRRRAFRRCESRSPANCGPPRHCQPAARSSCCPCQRFVASASRRR